MVMKGTAMAIKKIISILCMGTMFSSLQATMYEDAEDGLNTRWVAGNDGVVTNIVDADRNSKVISLQSGSYTIGDLEKEKLFSWNNRSEKNLKMSVKFSTYYIIYIGIETIKGHRLFKYTPRDGNLGDQGNGNFAFGVGKNTANGEWVDIIRNLESDLQVVEADNTIVAINGLKIVGNGLVDDLELKDRARHAEKMYDDAEDGDTFGWQVYDKSPLGATITNVVDAERNSKVIKLSGGGMENGYIVGNWNGRPNAWAELDRKTLTWDMKFSEAYGFFVTVETTKGHRYLYYDATNKNRGLIYGEYIHHGLTPAYMDGKWHTVSVDLQGDLQEFEPDNNIVRITGFLIRGSGFIDNIRFSDGPPILSPTLYEDAENGISEGWSTVIGDTLVKRETHAIDGVDHNYVRLQEHWHKNNDGTWTNPAEYHLEMHNRTQKILSFDVGGSGYNVPHYVTGARVTTRQGVRTLLWSSFYLHDNIAATNRNGFMIFPSPVEQVRGWFVINTNKWENFTVNLEESLQRFEPENSIVSVDYFVSTGGVLDNITLK